MKEKLLKKMESMYHLIEHAYHEISPLELTIYQLARGNTFDMRVVGLETIKRLREENPDCAITFKPNHLSEADFILLSLLFRENNLRVLIEGGSNLFIEEIDIFEDLLPNFLDLDLKDVMNNQRLSIARYLSTRGAFKVFRDPVSITQENGGETKIGKKDILSLTRAYRHHIVKEKEMYVTFPGYSTAKSGILELLKRNGLKTGRSYTGKIDGFHHLPFQMDIEASVNIGVKVYIVAVNMGYEQVMEDETFTILAQLQESGISQKEIYLKDLGHIIKEFCSDKKKGNLSIKFAEPCQIDTASLKDGLARLKIKSAAKKYADETFEKILAMQPVFPANIFFSAFDENFSRTPVQIIKNRIDDLRDHLRKQFWGTEKRRIDLHYIFGYDSHIISADEVINRTFQNFNTADRHITDIDGDMFVVYNKDVAQHYRNHTHHFFEDAKNHT
jgi:hypothetical protein